MHARSPRVRFAVWITSVVLLAVPVAQALAVTLTNPLGSTDIETIIGRLIRVILGLSGTAALAMFVYGGTIWIISRGEKSKVQEGKETIKWAILGLIFIFLAYSLLNFILDVATQAAGTSS